MMKLKKICKIFALTTLLVASSQTHTFAAKNETTYETFTENVSSELNNYIKKQNGTITVDYRDITTKEAFQIKPHKRLPSASTIKLPMALYIMELADQKKIDLDQKMIYKSYHRYGGSGLIQHTPIGSIYTIRDLVKKAISYSDNIAFIMLREKVGEKNLFKYTKKIGASETNSVGYNGTSAHDLSLFAERVYNLSQTSPNARELLTYLKQNVFNDTINLGVKGTEAANKSGWIPQAKASNDVAIVFDKNPFVLAVMTNGFPYEKSKQVIRDIAAIINKHHKNKENFDYIVPKSNVTVYRSASGKVALGTIRKDEAYKIVGKHDKLLKIQFGVTTGFIFNRNLTTYTSINSTFSNKKMEQKIKTIKPTNILKTASAQGKVIATVNKGYSVAVTKLNNNYYSVLVGNRLGFIRASDLEPKKPVTPIKPVEPKPVTPTKPTETVPTETIPNETTPTTITTQDSSTVDSSTVEIIE